jgi:carbon starvation protein CstA
MNTLWIVVIAAVVIYVAYNFYAKQIDKNVIKADAKKATPARMYMDGVDFMPTSRNALPAITVDAQPDRGSHHRSEYSGCSALVCC